MTWTEAEARQRLERDIERVEDLLQGTDEFPSFSTLGERAVRAKHEVKLERAKALASRKISGRNAEERNAGLYLWEVRPGVTIGDLELQADLLESSVETTKVAINSFSATGRLTQTIVVGERDNVPGGRGSPSR